MGQKTNEADIAVLQEQYRYITESLDDIKNTWRKKIETLEERQEELTRESERNKWWRNAIITAASIFASGAVVITPYIARVISTNVTYSIEQTMDQKIEFAIEDALSNMVFDIVE